MPTSVKQVNLLQVLERVAPVFNAKCRIPVPEQEPDSYSTSGQFVKMLVECERDIVCPQLLNGLQVVGYVKEVGMPAVFAPAVQTF
mmetsp:Transcript_4171/g.10113  ORF Transcript_4171/g.10113 Transcript_4171/m.10113 type:complete len:86 (-) Transcript_4171:1671-1928(-)